MRMSADEAKANQAKIAEHYDLAFWYGTNCKPCCGVYPKSMSFGSSVHEEHYYQCEVCGRRTEVHEMPWQSREAWNAGKTFFEEQQMTLWEMA